MYPSRFSVSERATALQAVASSSNYIQQLRLKPPRLLLKSAEGEGNSRLEIPLTRRPLRGIAPLDTMERTMRRMTRKIMCLLGLVLLAGSMRSVAVGQESSNLSGSITVTATSAAVGIGWSWGSGTLTLLDGSEHKFKVSGLDVVAVGFKQATGVGNVYNMKNLSDFEGQYVKAAVGIAVGGGASATSMRNDKGVVISLTGVGQGVDFRLATSGIEITLVK
jgi:hypothetical protein